MKKEDLVALGLDDEQINGVFKIRGLEIEANKEVLANLEAEKQAAEEAKEALEIQLKETSKSAVTPEALEELNSAKGELEAKLVEMEKEYQGKLKDLEYNHTLTNTLKETNAYDVKAIMPYLNQEELSFEDGKIVGLDEQLNAVREKHSFLFKQENEPAKLNKPQVATGSKGTGRAKVDPFKAAANRLTGKK